MAYEPKPGEVGDECDPNNLVGKAADDQRCSQDNARFIHGQRPHRQDNRRDGELVEQRFAWLDPGEGAGFDQHGRSPPQHRRPRKHAITDEHSIGGKAQRLPKRDGDASKGTTQTNDLDHPQTFARNKELRAQSDNERRHVEEDDGA